MFLYRSTYNKNLPLFFDASFHAYSMLFSAAQFDFAAKVD